MIKIRHMAQICRDIFAAAYGTAKWNDLSDRQRRLSTFLVHVIIDNPDATPRACHNAWMGEMIHNEGFKFGETVDETLKTHPNLVEYEKINDHTRHTYALSIAIVRALMGVEDHYINCAPSESSRRPVESIVFRETAPSDAHFVVPEPTGQTGPSETIDQPIGEVHFTGHNQVVDQVAEPVVEQSDDRALAQFGGPYSVTYPVTDSVDSIDTPAETDPARAE